MQIIRGKQKTALKVVVYGPEGIGKSTFAAQFPNPLFIDTEGGTKHMDVARTPKPTSWVMLLGLVKECIADPSLCGTLIIDTMDWAELLCSRYVCDKAQKKSIEEFGYGKATLEAVPKDAGCAQNHYRPAVLVRRRYRKHSIQGRADRLCARRSFMHGWLSRRKMVLHHLYSTRRQRRMVPVSQSRRLDKLGAVS